MTTYILHTTSENERWDSIAYRYYGNVFNFVPIIEANPHIKIDPVLPAGNTLKIPVEKAKLNDASKLPIWKREKND